MNRTILTLCGVALALPAFAQLGSDPLTRPLNESELLRTIDGFGSGDPATKPPLSFARAEGAEARAAEKKAAKEPDGKGPTEITAQEAAFDQKASQAVFVGDVVVKNPEFNVRCDKLTAFMKQDKGGGEPKATAGQPGAGNPKGDKEQSTGGLEKAIAEGSVIITQEKLDNSGRVIRNIGRAKKSVYDAISGDITLTGSPEVQQGINTIVSLDESTVMILNRAGKMRVVGPHKTVIKDTADNAR